MQRSIAALSVALTAKQRRSRIQLIPYGNFRADNDSGAGRPQDVAHWILDERNGFRIADAINHKKTDTVIDYEHQTMNSKQNGLPAPAAGWIKHAEFVPGAGLFADVEWTEQAAQMIKNGEYRYISPVFNYDDETAPVPGLIFHFLNAALTNSPALGSLDRVVAAASAFFSNNGNHQTMKLLDLLKQAFDMPDATEEQMTAALTALLKDKPAGVALSAVFTELTKRDQQIVALTANNNPGEPDLSEFVPVAVMKELQQQVAALTAQVNSNAATQLINTALAAGQLLPAQKEWAEGLAKTPAGLAQLSAYIDTVKPVAALTGVSQSVATGAVDQTKAAALSADHKETARMLGLSEQEYIDTYMTTKKDKQNG